MEIASESLESAKVAHSLHYLMLSNMLRFMHNNCSFKAWFGFCNCMITFGEMQQVHYRTMFQAVSDALDRDVTDEVESVCLIAQLLVQKCFDPNLVGPLVQKCLKMSDGASDFLRPKLYGVLLSYLTTRSEEEIKLPLGDIAHLLSDTIYSTPYEHKLLTVGLCSIAPSLASVTSIVRNLHTQFLTASQDNADEVTDYEILTDKLMSPLHAVDEYVHFRDYANRFTEAMTALLPHLHPEVQAQLVSVLELQRTSGTGLIRRRVKVRRTPKAEFAFS